MKELIKIFFVFTFFTLSLSQFYTFYPEQGIYDLAEGDESQCGKCPNYECDNITKICTDNQSDCMEAKTYGPYCDKPCYGTPYQCVLCNRSGEECLECPNNESWGIHCDESCERCPKGKCLITDGKCTEEGQYCDDPSYYGEYCKEECNGTYTNCVECLKESGVCTKCKKPFYNTDCESQCGYCPKQECYMNGTCTDTGSDCKDMLKRGEGCNEDCNWDVSEHCQNCHRNGTCAICEGNKFWGSNCTKSCGDHCPDNSECKIDGLCLNEEDNCHDNLTYGNYCLKYCNETHDKCTTCDRKGICLTCLDNKTYGENCEYSCEKCPEGLCDINGVCLDQEENCLNNLTFGASCNESCSNINISCSTCNRNETCIECINQAVFGDHCNKTCNCPGPNCEIDGTCVDYSGKCMDDSFYGRKCDQRCDEDRPNCVLCDIFGKCSRCSVEEYFGDNCTDICNHCPDRRCYINGSCININGTCPDNHFYGPNCNIPCNENNTNCDTCLRDGTCDNCKPSVYWGPNCNNTCEFCPNETCFNNGTCVDLTSNCVNETHYGNECDISCSEINNDCKLCNRMGKCLECSNNTIFGDTCNETCDNCPINDTDPYGYCFINGTCYNQIDSCTDEHYTGKECSVLCNSTHIYCDTCNRKGICSDCNDKTKFGTYCEDTCDKCPINDTDPYGYCFINGTCYNKFDLCTDDHYTGENCLELCNSTHIYCNTCDREGICSDCNDKTKFGTYCEDTCDNCPINEIDPYGYCFINGTCYNQNDSCINPHYTGKNCSELCNYTNIYCNTCDREGICFNCTNITKFGPYCEDSCERCPNLRNFELIEDTSDDKALCYMNGTCKNHIDVCNDHKFTGENCSVLCSAKYENCEECDRENICNKCYEEDRYGDECNIKCENCPDGFCYNNGECKDDKAPCKNTSLTGKFCNKTCDSIEGKSNCLECNREYTCLKCKDESFFGINCTQKCDNCPGNECDVSGNCKDKKTNCNNDIYTGENCSVLCNETINENCERCDREGNCLECSDKKKFGNKCDILCSNCPDKKGGQGNCDINGRCEDQDTICIDDSYYGEYCNISCFDISPHCKKCNREEKCTSCTDLKHRGDKCDQGCAECGPEGCNIKGYCKEFRCVNASYGLGCDQKCKCGSNSDDETCGKFRGQCSSCKFGYFGKQCNTSCNYKCQTELCCLFKEHKSDNMTILKVTTSYKTIQIKIWGKTYDFEIDYNYGYPLTIFNNETKCIDCKPEIKEHIKPIDRKIVSSAEEASERFTNWDISCYLYINDPQDITIGDVTITTDVAIAFKVKYLSTEEMKKNISGVIGLGFFNSISNAIFTSSSLVDYQLNILSFNYIKEGDQIEMLFGDLFEEQRDYVERLTSCKVILDGKSDIQEKKMTCQLDGIKVSKYSEAFKLNNSFITFSLGESSSLILGNNSNYLEYLKSAFFNNDNNYEIKEDKINKGLHYILYPSDKINKLPDIGFVFNYYSYSYPPDTFFVDNTNSNDAEGKKQFLIKINNNTDRTEFVIGKEFFNDTKFTINNEEAQIYFYAPNAQYCDKFTDEINDSLFNIKLNARETSAVCLSILVFIYLVAFTIYFFVKKKKMKSGDYIRIE